MIFGCSGGSDSETVDRIVFSDSPLIEVKEGILYYKNSTYTGKLAERVHSKSHQMIRCVEYKNGLKEGNLVEWYHDGTKKLSAGYSENKLHGVLKEWWNNGQLKRWVQYSHGEASGLSQCWDQNGENLEDSYSR